MNRLAHTNTRESIPDSSKSHGLNSPHGGKLTTLMVNPDRRREILAESQDYPSWDLTPRQLCDLEMLLNGAFSPLQGFMLPSDYESVCASMRLAEGLVWPIPIVLDVPEEVAAKLGRRNVIALRDPEGTMLAALHVEEVWQPDRRAEAEAIFGTSNREHPGVAYLLDQTHPCYVGGRLEGIEQPVHYDFPDLRLTPAGLRAEFSRCGWTRIVAFQTRNPMHRAHLELTLRAAQAAKAKLLIHPSVGMTKPGDVDHYTRVRCYQALLPYFPGDMAKLSLLPLAMRMAGPREALWHAIIRKNYGCSHFIIGRDHAGPGQTSAGKPFYGPYEAQELVKKHQEELGVQMVPFRKVVYLEEQERFVPEDEAPPEAKILNLSGTRMRQLLTEGQEIPTWFTFPSVASELQRKHPPRHSQGFTVFFTGLSGAGKSTLANVLLVKLLEMGNRPVTLLDGDLVRKNLSSELGFSKEHRDLNIRRIGFVASEITKHRGIAICAPIAPYDRVRKEVRALIESEGGFILVHLATPLEICEQRDRKGLYAKARAGKIQQFTGISDPYESPEDAELVIDTNQMNPAEATRKILSYLQKEGYLPETRRAAETPRLFPGNNGDFPASAWPV